MIDTHIHADTRSSEDFGIMSQEGIKTAITCSYYPYKLNNNPDILINHFERILNFETKRAGEYNLDLKVALGMHPTNTLRKSDKIFEYLEKMINTDKIVAIGEIGLDENTEEEKIGFKKQLEIADETNTKVIIHTPRKNKKSVLKDIKEIVLENIKPNLVVMDHINKETIEDVIDEGFKIGLTVQPQKLTPKDAVDILDNYGFNNFLLNSDISNKPSDILSIPKTVKELEKLNYNRKEIEKVKSKNAKSFFKI